MDIVHEAMVGGRYLGGVGWPALTLALLLHLAKRAARARAWQGIVHAAHPDEHLQYRQALTTCFAAVAVSSLSPVRGGELVRLALVKRVLPSAPLATLGATVVAEAAADLVVGVPLVAAALAVGLSRALPEPSGLTQLVDRPVALAVGGAVLLTAAVLSRFGAARARQLRSAASRGLAVFSERGQLARHVAPWLLLAWLLRFGSVAAFLEAFAIDAAPGVVLAVIGAQLLSTLVPLSVAGAGAQQALLVLALADTTEPGQAIGLGLGMQASTLVVNVVAGGSGLVLAAGTFRVRSLARAVQT